MRTSIPSRIAVLFVASLLSGYAQVVPKPDAQPEAKGMPPRATPGDYQFHTQAGTVSIAGEFTGHSLPTADGPLTTEDYVAVEVGLFGPTGARLTISSGDFSLRINRKKGVIPSQTFGAVFSSLKDPEWVAPETEQKAGKTSVNSGGKEKGDSNSPPPVVKIPVPVMRAMAQRVQKAALPEGDRALPQAGLVFFGYHGKATNLQSIELIYEGPAGKATLQLQQK